MNQLSLNEILLNPEQNISKTLLEYLLNCREVLNLMIMAGSVKEMGWSESHTALSNLFKENICALSNADKSDLSNFTTIVRYRDHDNQCTRGLCITFGKNLNSHTYNSSFLKDVNLFIKNLPDYKSGLTPYITLPIIRMCILIHSMRNSLNGSTPLAPLELNNFNLLDFNSNEWRYTTGFSTQQYVINIKSNDFWENSVFLKVSRPYKQLSPSKLEDCFIFKNEQTGFSFYNTKTHMDLLKKIKVKNAKKAPYIQTQNLGTKNGKETSEILKDNLKKLASSISNHETYWNTILYDLLTKAGINFKQKIFTPTEAVFIDKTMSERGFEITNNFLGFDCSKVTHNNEFNINYYIAKEVYFDIQNKNEEKNTVIDKIKDLILEFSTKHNTLKHTIKLNFIPVHSIHTADLVIGRYDASKSWISNNITDDIDEYGIRKQSDLTQGKLNTQQFIDTGKLDTIEPLQSVIPPFLDTTINRKILLV